MSSNSVQKTLGAFGFKRSVIHRGEKTEIKLPHNVKEEERRFSCSFCEEKFKSPQGLGVHVKCRHGEQGEVSQKDKNNQLVADEKDQEVTQEQAAPTIDVVVVEDVPGTKNITLFYKNQ